MSHEIRPYLSITPVMYSDESGHMPEWLKNVLDIGATVLSVSIGLKVGLLTGNPLLGAATATAMNTGINMLYYDFISTGETNITSSSYNDKYISRWDRLDYTKQQTNNKWYGLNEMR